MQESNPCPPGKKTFPDFFMVNLC